MAELNAKSIYELKLVPRAHLYNLSETHFRKPKDPLLKLFDRCGFAFGDPDYAARRLVQALSAQYAVIEPPCALKLSG